MPSCSPSGLVQFQVLQKTPSSKLNLDCSAVGITEDNANECCSKKIRNGKCCAKNGEEAFGETINCCLENAVLDDDGKCQSPDDCAATGTKPDDDDESKCCTKNFNTEKGECCAGPGQDADGREQCCEESVQQVGWVGGKCCTEVGMRKEPSDQDECCSKKVKDNRCCAKNGQDANGREKSNCCVENAVLDDDGKCQGPDD